MDVAGTAVGIASLGVQICQGLLTYYDGWQGYHSDSAVTCSSISQLKSAFVQLNSLASVENGQERCKNIISTI